MYHSESEHSLWMSMWKIFVFSHYISTQVYTIILLNKNVMLDILLLPASCNTHLSSPYTANRLHHLYFSLLASRWTQPQEIITRKLESRGGWIGKISHFSPHWVTMHWLCHSTEGLSTYQWVTPLRVPVTASSPCLIRHRICNSPPLWLALRYCTCLLYTSDAADDRYVV